MLNDSIVQAGQFLAFGLTPTNVRAATHIAAVTLVPGTSPLPDTYSTSPQKFKYFSGRLLLCRAATYPPSSNRPGGGSDSALPTEPKACFNSST
jgi:hypothetical protein